MIRLLLLLVLACEPTPGDTTRCEGLDSLDEQVECCADAGDQDCASGMLPVEIDLSNYECQPSYCDAYYEAGCPHIGVGLAPC